MFLITLYYSSDGDCCGQDKERQEEKLLPLIAGNYKNIILQVICVCVCVCVCVVMPQFIMRGEKK